MIYFFSVRSRFLVGFFLLFSQIPVLAAQGILRWTGAEDSNSEFGHILEKINTLSGLQLTFSDFMIYEDRELATSHFRMYIQTLKGIPIHKTSIRLWTDSRTHGTIQLEAQVEDPKALELKLGSWAGLSGSKIQSSIHRMNIQSELIHLVKKAVKANKQDPYLQNITAREEWKSGELVKLYKVRGKRGYLMVEISLARRKILSTHYQPFGQVDQVTPDEFNLPALVYPVWEETPSGKPQTRVMGQLKHLKSFVPQYGSEVFEDLRTRSYLAEKQDHLLGMTEEGIAQGYWSPTDLQKRIQLLRQKLPRVPNTLSKGIILEGRYVTVSLHPDIAVKFPGMNFNPMLSTQIAWDWKEKFSEEGEDQTEALLRTALLGRPIHRFEDTYTRPARRLFDHDTTSYINDGFDEVQVYYAVDTFMDSLFNMGFNDPEISTRPFNAFLYNPDVQMRNNAFYDADTINFTTYDGVEQNYARDNATIWHELGHGIMDRVMGDMLSLNDSGGLAEGMADFLAQLVISKTTKLQRFDGDKEFRIINKTGFNLTNESHDDGEAYGGAMYDILNGAIRKFGYSGLSKVTDLTIETMRFTRNHPSLDASEWFRHMLFADSLGRENTREPSELHDIILAALEHRNFSFSMNEVAVFHLYNGAEEISEDSDGLRSHPIELKLKKDESQSFHLSIKLNPGTKNVIQFPVNVKVAYQGGALEGAVHWKGEENGPQSFIINSPEELLSFDVTPTATCDFSNREDGSCSDYVYIQLFPLGYDQPIGKKRFYVHVLNKAE